MASSHNRAFLHDVARHYHCVSLRCCCSQTCLLENISLCIPRNFSWTIGLLTKIYKFSSRLKKTAAPEMCFVALINTKFSRVYSKQMVLYRGCVFEHCSVDPLMTDTSSKHNSIREDLKSNPNISRLFKMQSVIDTASNLSIGIKEIKHSSITDEVSSKNLITRDSYSVGLYINI